MQEKTFDKNQLIGFALMILLFIGYWMLTQKSPEELEAERLKQEQVVQQSQPAQTPTTSPIQFSDDSQPAQSQFFTLENENVRIELTSLGAQIAEVEMKNHKAYDESAADHQEPLYLIKDNNAKFSLNFTDNNGRQVDLSQRYFSGSQDGNTVVFTTSEDGGVIQYTYTLAGDYQLDMQIGSRNFRDFSNQNTGDFNWMFNTYSHEKGKDWESRNTEIYYSLNGYDKQDYTTRGFNASANQQVDWVAIKQQFFSTILERTGGIQNMRSSVDQPANDSLYSKEFAVHFSVPINGEINEQYRFNFLPLDYYNLKAHNKGFEEIIPFGWGLFGWINEYIILPTFKFMANWGLHLGWVIALLTIVIKLITSPIMYKQYRQSAMMRLLKPEMDEINEKFKGQDNAMKRQQEMMGLYRKAGVNPLAGCLPALLQIPIFYALFNFFPNVIDLRGVSFLWAEDLTAFDNIVNLPFHIPFYGAHISLFALLYVITMVIYFRLSGTNFSAPTQEGMPNMKFIMYLMPIMFLFFLNSYASGLSWYYFVSNAINIGIVFIIKNFMIDDDKIHAKIQENKEKPKKKSKWAERLDAAMKQAQEQQQQKKALEQKQQKAKKK
ncbi:MAG: membrane protein insertase YidC [Weeksellaceae bacterium]|nr:membrane protein insertase YidC [Weeksellaceae bacterium]